MSISRAAIAEPRPKILDDATLDMAIHENRRALLDWLSRHQYRQDSDTESSLLEVVRECVSRAAGEPARAARLLELAGRWHVDEQLIHHLTIVQKNINHAFHLRVARWVAKSGVRFPGKQDDLIVWRPPGETSGRTAQITKIIPHYAQATIKGESGGIALIDAEAVVENRTNPSAMYWVQPFDWKHRLPNFGQRLSPPAVVA